MKISWVILTHNRHEVVNDALLKNLHNAGEQATDHVDVEIIWVDNASANRDEFLLNVSADVKVFNRANLGVARGYNQGLAMATGDYILITGCDRLMPPSFAARMIEAARQVPNTGIISCYSHPLSEVPERKRGEIETINGIEIQQAIPFEARFLSRKLFREIGYYHEGLGLYGWEDVLWGERAEKITKEKGLINYILPGNVAQHLGDEGIKDWNGTDDQEYHAFKQRESRDPKKTEICNQYRKDGLPYINPFI